MTAITTYTVHIIHIWMYSLFTVHRGTCDVRIECNERLPLFFVFMNFYAQANTIAVDLPRRSTSNFLLFVFGSVYLNTAIAMNNDELT